MTRSPRIVPQTSEALRAAAARMTPEEEVSAAERLAEILNDPGPNIKVTPRTWREEDALDAQWQADEASALADDAGVPPAAPADRSDTAGTSAERAPRRDAAPRPTSFRPTPPPAERIAPASQTEDLRHIEPATRAKLERLVERQAMPAAAGAPPPTASWPVAGNGGATPGFGQIRRDGELYAAIAASRDAILATGVFSLVINVLMLTGPLFMLQVYDRVMTSGSIPTLIALAALTGFLYAAIGLLELVRSRVVVRVGLEFDRRIADRVFRSALRRGVTGKVSSVSALRELDQIRQFVAGPGPITLFDAPWTVVYLAVIFLLHWTLGLTATIGAAILVALTLASERLTRQPLIDAGKANARSIELAETGQRNAEAIAAMGMLDAYRSRWQRANGEALAWQTIAADRIGSISATTKTLRLALQSLMLAVGAALALANEISAGTIVAATIIFGRALAPVEQAIGQWRTMLKAIESYTKIDLLLRETPEPAARTALPAPAGHIDVEGLRVAAPETRQLILANLAFSVEPGQMLAVIGPSASGKSTLARALVGLWPPFGGSIRLDGARLEQWNPEELGRHIGYLPQTVELFSGTVRDNISRFRPDARDEDVVAAARMAHAHDLILALPNGYESEVGPSATYLSGGQRQRIGLARALFGNPVLVVLDEPNANLDRAGDEALAAAIDGMRARGQAIVLISHRVQAISKADLLLYLDRGVQRAFGPRSDVMRMLQGGLGSDQAAERAPQPATPVPGGRDGAKTPKPASHPPRSREP
ncbi:MAG: type I secretion system permease/ATPase [Hyphomicrobiaceae bacterium]